MSNPPASPALRVIAFAAALVAIIVPERLMAGDGKPTHAISFHAEIPGGEGGKRSFRQMIQGQEKIFRLTAELTEKEFASFFPFPADDGASQGAVFILNERGTFRLNAYSMANQGSILLTTIDGRAVDYMVVDRPVKDGIITVWRGLTPEIITWLQKDLKLPLVQPRAGR